MLERILTFAVNNDFQQPRAIFELLDGLEAKDMDVPVSSGGAPTNGAEDKAFAQAA